MRPWIYLTNPFLVATEGSYRSMKKIGNFTSTALDSKAGNSFFDGLQTNLKPFVTNFNTSYNNWYSKKGQQLGQSSNLKTMLKTLSSDKIKEWDLEIQRQYKDHSPQYIALLPYHRIPFQSGSQRDKLDAIQTLITSIGSDTKLQTLKTEITSFYTDLKAAFDSQKGSIQNTGNHSNEVEAARIALAKELYGTLGQLMSHYKEQPELVADFFDMQTLRNHEQSIFKHDIKAGETLVALTHTFDTDEEIELINRGSTKLLIALVADANSDMPATATVLAANSSIVVLASTLGDIKSRFLKVQNTDAAHAGAYTIELL